MRHSHILEIATREKQYKHKCRLRKGVSFSTSARVRRDGGLRPNVEDNVASGVPGASLIWRSPEEAYTLLLGEP